MSFSSHDNKGKLLICKFRLEHLLNRIKLIESNNQLSVSDKLLKIKIIKEEIDKVGKEIDKIKKEIILSKTNSNN